MSARYRNSFFRSDGAYGPEFYETDARPTEHNGFLIYERIKKVCWDVVRDGVCVAQRAGLSGARRFCEQPHP